MYIYIHNIIHILGALPGALRSCDRGVRFAVGYIYICTHTAAYIYMYIYIHIYIYILVWNPCISMHREKLYRIKMSRVQQKPNAASSSAILERQL